MKTYFGKFYKSQGFLWNISEIGEVEIGHIEGPYCLNCKMDILFPPEAYYTEIHPDFGEYQQFNPDYSGKVKCSMCERKYEIPIPLRKFKEKVKKDYVLKKRSDIPIESLDELPSQIKVRDEDKKYFLAAKLTEKNGKRVGVVYFGEKNKDQTKKDYTQLFLDIDDEQIRFDKGNKNPKEQLTKLQVVFKESAQQTAFSTSKKNKLKNK